MSIGKVPFFKGPWCLIEPPSVCLVCTERAYARRYCFTDVVINARSIVERAYARRYCFTCLIHMRAVALQVNIRLMTDCLCVSISLFHKLYSDLGDQNPQQCKIYALQSTHNARISKIPRFCCYILPERFLDEIPITHVRLVRKI